MLGARLVKDFAARRMKVISLVSSHSKHIDVNCEISIDISSDLTQLAPLVSAATHIVHCAAVISPRYVSEFQKVNVEGTRQVVQLAKEIGAKLIYVSSFDVNWAEESHYAKSKKMAEEIVGESGVDAWVLRPTYFYGSLLQIKNDFGIFFNTFFLTVDDGLSKCQPLKIEQLANIIYGCVVGKLRPATYEVAGLEALSYRNLLERVASRKRFFYINLHSNSIKRIADLFPFISCLRIISDKINLIAKDRYMLRSSQQIDLFNGTLVRKL